MARGEKRHTVPNEPRVRHQPKPRIEICILAGGLSSRMGHDKARLRLGGRTLLSNVRHIAARLDIPVRVIRRDLVPRCGPIGGVITAFHRGRADAVLFLACDMPFITADLLRRVLRASRSGTAPVFATTRDGNGFPFLLPRSALPIVEAQRAKHQFSLQKLSRAVRARELRVRASLVFNINTPEDLALAGARN
jgi:molybdopterin-guanine dinucleotide biosynthesis protein A